ncbi:MAG: YebC/PmpR family DNA-binding transcriptional regulator [Deltaproteobacteria bacterium]
MSGHSKWSKIKRKKGANDAKRSKIFGRIIKEITVSVREGQSGDPEFNSRLRLAVSNAKGANMPKETIDRAIKKAFESKGDALFQPTFEGYGPGGVAIFLETMTDNNQRTVANVRAIFNKRGGNLATSGSVGFMFERKGIFLIDPAGKDLEELELEMIDAGVEDFDIDDETGEVELTVDFADFGTIQKKLEELGIEPKSATLERIPTTTTKVDVNDAKKALALVEFLEEDDDVQAVYHNLEMTEEIEAALEE